MQSDEIISGMMNIQQQKAITFEKKITELEEKIQRLTWRVNDLEERVFGYHE